VHALYHPAISYSESVQFHDTHIYAIISDYRGKTFRQRKEASISLRNVVSLYSHVEHALILPAFFSGQIFCCHLAEMILRSVSGFAP